MILAASHSETQPSKIGNFSLIVHIEIIKQRTNVFILVILVRIC